MIKKGVDLEIGDVLNSPEECGCGGGEHIEEGHKVWRVLGKQQSGLYTVIMAEDQKTKQHQEVVIPPWVPLDVIRKDPVPDDLRYEAKEGETEDAPEINAPSE